MLVGKIDTVGCCVGCEFVQECFAVSVIDGKERKLFLVFDEAPHKSRLLQVTIFVTSMAEFPAMNAVWDAWVVPGQTPPRATVQAALARPEYKVEIKVIAAQG